MKKIFALILVVLMLVPFVVACGSEKDDKDTPNTPPQNTNTDVNTGTGTGTNTDTNTNTNTDTSTNTNSGASTNTDTSTSTGSGTSTDTSVSTNTNTNTSTGPSVPSVDKIDVDSAQIKNMFTGKTVNIMASGSWSVANSEPGAPWGQVELCATEYFKDANGFGTMINDAVLDRKLYVEETYGVTLNYVDCKSAAMNTRLITAAENKGYDGEVIHIAMPRVFESQSIVVNDCVYNLSESSYIDFSKSYYNQEAVESYTLAGKTFFGAGDISFLDEQTSFIIFYNMAIANESAAFPDLFQATLDGTWTVDQMYTLASAVSESLDGKQEQTDLDKYGFGTRGLSVFYQYFGVYQVGKSTNANGDEIYALTVEDDKVSTIISKMLACNNNPRYIRTTWEGYETMGEAFLDNRLLFYHEVIQKLDYLEQEDDLEYGILPFPKLIASQERYYVPSASQTTLVCIPRATDNRQMSEVFLEVLSKSASEYIMPAYMDTIESQLCPEYREQTMEVLEKAVFPNLMYDQGYMYDYGGLVTESIQNASIEGGENTFVKAYENGRTAAETTLSNWTYAYHSYVDEW